MPAKKTEQIKPQEPKVKMFGLPKWWHHHGSKMSVKEEKSNMLSLGSRAASVIIEKRLAQGWMIEYHIQHSAETYSMGRIWMCDKDLERAFMLSTDYPAQGGQHLIDEFGGETAYQGKFIRYKGWLNLPGPGTGHDGDPNLSVWVDSDIQEVVQRLIEKAS